MKRHTASLIGASLALLAVAPVFAADSGDQAVILYAAGGGIDSAKHFDPNLDSRFKTGYDLLGGLGYQFNDWLALRGSFNFARARGQDADGDFTGFNLSEYNRYIYSAEVQLSQKLVEGVTPYVIAGGGGITWSNRTLPGVPTSSKPFGKFGLGINFDIPRSRVGLFVQSSAMMYNWDGMGSGPGLKRTLLDYTWNAGLRLRLPV